MISGLIKIYKSIIKRYALLLLNIDWRYFIVFFFFSILLVGIFTVPRFNDGIWHLAVAKEWFNTDALPKTVWGNSVTEAPLWYFLVQLLCHIIGSFSYWAAQLLQSILYGGILILTYKIAFLQTKSNLISKCALIFVGSIPMLSVTSVLCFIDIICAFFVLLAIWFLINKKFLFALLAGVGIWYSKRTGVLELPTFFIFFALYLFQNKNRNWLKTFFALTNYGMLFLLLIAPDIIRRIINYGIMSSYAVNYKTKHILLNHSPNAAKGIPVDDTLLWIGGVGLALTILLPLGLYLRNRKHSLKLWFTKHYIIVCIFILTIFFFSLFPLGRVTVRYWAIVIPLSIISITALLFKTKLKSLVIILTIVAFFQHCCVMIYVYQKRQIYDPEKQVFAQLTTVAKNKKIVWFEQRFGQYYLDKKIYWPKYLKIFLTSGINHDSSINDLGAIVIAKRYLYHYRGIYYDRGIPYSLLAKFKNSNKYRLVLDNEKYYVFEPIISKL